VGLPLLPPALHPAAVSPGPLRRESKSPLLLLLPPSPSASPAALIVSHDAAPSGQVRLKLVPSHAQLDEAASLV